MTKKKTKVENTTTETTSVSPTTSIQTVDTQHELKCVWNTGEKCMGEVKMRKIFGHNGGDPKLEIPMCDGHIEEHSHIMFLYANGFDIQMILDMPASDRKREALTLELSGIAKIEDTKI